MTAAVTTRALQRYRVIAYLVGTLLAVLAFVAVPVRYAVGEEAWYGYGWTAHGALYIFYFLAGVDLAMRLRWSWRRTLLVVLAGTIPVLTFVAERKVARWAREPVST